MNACVLQGTWGPTWLHVVCCVSRVRLLPLGLRDEPLTALLILHHLLQSLNHSVEVGGSDERQTDVLQHLEEHTEEQGFATTGKP